MAGPAGRVDAVFGCGGRWHDFAFVRHQLLGALGDWEQVRTRVFEDYCRPEALERADLLVTYTCDVRPTPEQQDALVQFVERGGRWLALHGTHSAIEPPDASGVCTVCYFALGHCRGRFDVQDLGVDDLGRRDFGSWEVPEFGTVLGRCLAWAVTGEFPTKE